MKTSRNGVADSAPTLSLPRERGRGGLLSRRNIVIAVAAAVAVGAAAVLLVPAHDSAAAP